MGKTDTEVTLSTSELLDCIDLYEGTLDAFWMPGSEEAQSIWVMAFEQAKAYFNQS